MARRLALLATSVIAGVMAFGGTVDAGSWAVTMVDPFDGPVAGEPLDVSFTILQHGETPVDVDGVQLVVVEPDGDRLTFPATGAGEVGRYVATIELEEAGRHQWSVVQGWFGPQDLGGLEVAPRDGPAVAWSTIAWPAATVVGIVAVVGGATLLGLTVHRRRLRRAALS